MKKGDSSPQYAKSLEQHRSMLRGLGMESKIARFPALSISNTNTNASSGNSNNNVTTEKTFKYRPKKDKSWIKYFLDLPGNDFMAEVEKEYIHDRFNLTGLSEQFPRFQEALKVILDEEDFAHGPRKVDGTPVEVLEQSAEVLYGIIHARFLLTPRGVEAMKKKYSEKKFGKCPRVLCGQHSLLPVGVSDVVGTDSVKLYCPVCQEMYHADPTRYQNCDGAFFGTGFPAMFLMTLPDNRPKKLTPKYIPRLFGFKIHPKAIGPWNDETFKKESSAADIIRSRKR